MRVPLTTKGRKVKGALAEQYGAARGERVFYAMINAGKLTGAEASKRKAKGRPKRAPK